MLDTQTNHDPFRLQIHFKLASSEQKVLQSQKKVLDFKGNPILKHIFIKL